MRLFALHDKKAASLTMFFAAKNDTVASRDFASGVVAPDSMMGKYPDDFELVVLADLGEVVRRGKNLVDSVCGDVGVNEFAFEVVVTARQVIDLQRPADGQLSLLKEAQ